MFKSSVCTCRSLSRCLLLLGLLAGLLLAFVPVVRAEPVVRIGTGDWVPYVDQQRSDAGALARLVSAVFAKAGYRAEFVFYPWDRNVLMLEQGNLDAIMPYSCSPKRLDVGVCSDPLVRGEIVLFHRTDMSFDWRRVEDLKSYRIATTHGYSYGSLFDRALQDGTLRAQQSSKEDTGLRLLTLGRIDLHPQDRAVGYSMLQRLFPQTQDITHHPRSVSTEPLRLLFRRGDPVSAQLLERFNAELARFAGRGELKRLQEALYSGNADQWQPGL